MSMVPALVWIPRKKSGRILCELPMWVALLTRDFWHVIPILHKTICKTHACRRPSERANQTTSELARPPNASGALFCERNFRSHLNTLSNTQQIIYITPALLIIYRNIGNNYLGSLWKCFWQQACISSMCLTQNSSFELCHPFCTPLERGTQT